MYNLLSGVVNIGTDPGWPWSVGPNQGFGVEVSESEPVSISFKFTRVTLWFV